MQRDSHSSVLPFVVGGEGTYIVLYMLLDNNIDYDAYYYVIVRSIHVHILLLWYRSEGQAFHSMTGTSHCGSLPDHGRAAVRPSPFNLNSRLQDINLSPSTVPYAHLPL